MSIRPEKRLNTIIIDVYERVVTNVKLVDVKGAYDVIISLGSWCGPSINLRQRQLRRFSFPLDWMITNSISDVTRLLSNRFIGFMELEHMRKIEGTSALLEDGIATPAEGRPYHDAHFILDTQYDMISVHDFPIWPNQDWTQSYASYKEKINHRIHRFYEVLNNSRSVLFIRWGEVNAPEAALLHAVLSSFVAGTCNILFLRTMHDIQDVQELDWGIDGVCTLQVPIDRPNDESIWNHAMEGLYLTGYWKD